MRSRVARRAVLTALVVGVASALPPVQARVKAAGVVADALERPWPRPFAKRVERSQTRLGDVTGDLYVPGDEAPPLVLVHGAAPEGKDDPRLIRLARALAAADRLVFVPDLELKNRTFEERDIDRIVRSIAGLSRHPSAAGEHVQVVGISYGGSFALVAAADERVRERVAAERVRDLGQQTGLDRLLERLEQRVALEVGDPLEHVQLEVAPDHRGHRQDARDRLGQSRDAAPDHLLDARGDAHLGKQARASGRPAAGLEHARLGQVADGLLEAVDMGVEVAARAVAMRLHEVSRGADDGVVAALVLVGVGSGLARYPAGGAVAFVGPQPPEQVRNFLAAADVCVIPSLRTRGFREPWGLVANEAMNQSTPVIASDEVGAVAGGLVRHERNGLVVSAGDATALAAALQRMHDDPALRAELGANARRDVAAYTFEAWATGFETAIGSLR
ncbi:MAG: glycosyltransferase [Actinobacteria bacterium]|nr:glycosyltransferase [Actinomycetota bacterium]